MSRRLIGSIARKISGLVEDKTPQLGGDLDLNGKNIDFPTTADISDCLDEDDMTSDSATMLATQQSIKAYADIKARINTGAYTGDGTTSQGITGIGFAPKYVRIWLQSAIADATGTNWQETTDDAVDDDASGYSIHSSGDGTNQWRTNEIISLDSDGFTVDDDGADATPNTNGSTYKFLAIG